MTEPLVTIQPCRAGDLAELEQHIPSPGRNRFHEARFARHQQGLSTFLIAFDNAPVGCAEILWSGCRAPEVTERCPELSGLTVAPDHQSRGIGTALLHAAESLVAARSITRLGLGVDDQNVRAAALYLRLGYCETGRHYLDRYAYLDDSGVTREAADPCRFLVKDIAIPG